jgi:hypothetical protein
MFAADSLVSELREQCPMYDGFKYHTMSEDPRAFRWSPVWAEHNWKRAVETLTVEKDELKAEIVSLLATVQHYSQL